MARLAATRTAAAAGSTCEEHAISERQVLFGVALDNWEPVNDRTVLILVIIAGAAFGSHGF